LLVRRWPREGRATHYRGFDGSAIWPEELLLTIKRTDGLAELDQWAALDTIAREHSAVFPYDAVIVAHAPSMIVAPGATELFGYDFGWYDAEYSHFSSIRNEAMRNVPDLWRDGFNEYGLLPTLEDVDRYAAMRESLRREGANIELAGPEPYPIMVFGAPTPTSRPL
jgi:hypothetical protein